MRVDCSRTFCDEEALIGLAGGMNCIELVARGIIAAVTTELVLEVSELVVAVPAILAPSFAIRAARRARTRFLFSALVPGGRQSVSVLRRWRKHARYCAHT